MSLNTLGKVTHYNPDKKNPPDQEIFMERARAGFYAILTDEGIRLTDRQTTVHITKNGRHQLVHKLDEKTFGLMVYFLQATHGKILTHWLKHKFETGDFAAIERAYGISFRRKE